MRNQKQSSEQDNKTSKTSVFGRLSKVNQEKSWFSKKVLPVLIGGVGLLIILMMFRGHHEEKLKEEAVHQQKVKVATALLKEKLEALKTQAEKQASSTDQSISSSVNNSMTYSKELIARMNAPTSVFENGSHSSSGQSDFLKIAMPATDQAVPEATFMGKGANQDFGNTNCYVPR